MVNTMDVDIVYSLRWAAESAAPVDAGQMRAAADEIERLRTQGNGLADRVNSLLADRQELWRTVSDMKAAAETAGYVFRNTDSGPALVR